MLAPSNAGSIGGPKGATVADEDGKTFTQEDLNRVAADRAAQAARAEAARITEALGMSPEDAKAKLAAAAQAERDALTVGERLAAAEAKAEQATRDADERIRVATAQAAARVELVSAGIPATSLDTVLRMVDTSATAAPVTDQISKLQTDLPQLFAKSGTGEPVGTPAGSMTKQQTGPSKSVDERVAERLSRLNLGGSKK